MRLFRMMKYEGSEIGVSFMDCAGIVGVAA